MSYNSPMNLLYIIVDKQVIYSIDTVVLEVMLI